MGTPWEGLGAKSGGLVKESKSHSSRRRPTLHDRPKVAPGRRPKVAPVGAARKAPFWRKPAVWLGSLATVVLGGVLISVLSAEAQRIVPSAPASLTPAPERSGSAGAGPPLIVVSEQPLNVDDFAYWSFPGRLVLSPSQLKHLNSIFLADPTSLPVANYFDSLGGYALAGTETQVVVQNKRSHPVRIIDMHVIKSCHAPPTGTVFDSPGQAADETIGLEFNLDSADTGAKIARGYGTSPTTDYFSEYTISIEPGSQQVLRLETATSHHSCTFWYRATILDGEKKVYQLIGDGRQPFRISSGTNGTAINYLSGYSVAYVGGPGSPSRNGAFVRVNPKTYR